jgi:hypothetical protein
LAFVGLVSSSGCGAKPPSQGDDLGLAHVLRIYQVDVGPADHRLCQVKMDVAVLLPNCGVFGAGPYGWEGSTFHLEMHANYFANACYGAAYEADSELCLPGNFQDPPPPPLPTGPYQVEVNGVTGSFTIP